VATGARQHDRASASSYRARDRRLECPERVVVDRVPPVLPVDREQCDVASPFVVDGHGR
jgi:hypothetical protein